MHHDDNTVCADPALGEHKEPNPPLVSVRENDAAPIIRSGYLVERLFQTPENNLFNYVKFHLVSRHIQRAGGSHPRIMDIGCGLQVAKRFLCALNPNISYFGCDYEATFQPDAVVDLNEPGALDNTMTSKPDVVMLLDVLEHLHDNTDDLGRVIKHIALSMPKEATLVVTVPQLYRLDCLKLKHLHYPEHKIRLTQTQWRQVLEEHFDIKAIQGVGYLSVFPYLPMLSKHYRPDNRLGKLFNHLRSVTLEKSWIKPVDLFLSNTLGKLKPFQYLSNDILFVAVPRKAR